MPYSSIVLPPDRRQWVPSASVAVHLALGLLWTAWSTLGRRPGVDPWGVAGTVVLAVALGWCVAALSVRGLRPWERLRVVAAGTAALALWVPLPLIGFMAFMVAAYVPLLFPILVGVMLVLVWAEVWATGALASHATKSLLGLRQPDHGAI